LKKRIVVTGVGPITPIGIGKQAFWDALLAGKNGIERITRFDATNYAAQIAGEVKDFDVDGYIDKKEAKRMDRYAQFAVVSAGMALKDAGIDLEKVDRDRIGAYVGAGIGGIETMHSTYERLFDKGPERVSPFFIPMMIANMAAGQVAINYGLHGPVSCVVTACATGANCVGDAYRVMQRGEADIMIAGGTEASISEAASAGFAGGFISGAGNSWVGGSSFGKGLLAGLGSGSIGALEGGIAGGLLGGLDALDKGTNFWTGKTSLALSQGYAASVNFKIGETTVTGKYVGTYKGQNVFESSKLGSYKTGKYTPVRDNRVSYTI